YEPYVGVVLFFSQILRKDRLEFYEGRQQRAAIEGERHDIALQTHIITGDEVEAVVAFLDEQKMDLVVMGLHRYTPRLARLWSTVYALEQEAPCSILGVH
ncbi:MAG TPA: universal stress protein, partial [Acidobacteriaceae bacterium]